MSDVGDKEGSFVEAHGELPSRTAAPSQASTMMPASYDKNATTQRDGSCKGISFVWGSSIGCLK